MAEKNTSSKAPPKATPRCDVGGCGRPAVGCTDGSEVDVQGLGRPALPKLYVCAIHTNWPHSEDARIFAASDEYAKR